MFQLQHEELIDHDRSDVEGPLVSEPPSSFDGVNLQQLWPMKGLELPGPLSV